MEGLAILIQRASVLTGVIRTRNLDVTNEQLQSWLDGELIQNAMPHLSPDDREFIKTGITSEEWDAAFAE